MKKDKIYYSIRVVKATTYDKAIIQVEDNIFLEDYDICDKVLTKSQLEKELKKRKE
jgi:hypothetical protein